MVDAGADPAAVTVVAVTKGFGPEAVRAALDAGLADVGENYAQELVGKAAEIPEPVRWHFLGAPQRNKIPALAPLVALWQGVDRDEVLDAIARRRPDAAVLVEVNVAGDEAKHGCRPEDAAGLVERGRDLGLDVRGLMTVAPAGDRHSAQRCFAELAGMAGSLGLKELSMGMSDDFDLAVAEGATMVRLGRALFGPRPGPARARR
jgi:pyridoxal phosphate enzyme (YggS family)